MVVEIDDHLPTTVRVRVADPNAGSMAGATGLEPATSGVTGRRSNQLSYAPDGQGPKDPEERGV
jgi:hypothetical protein